MKPIHNPKTANKKYRRVANNPKFRKMKPIHNDIKEQLDLSTVANNPKFRKMKPIHNKCCYGAKPL